MPPQITTHRQDGNQHPNCNENESPNPACAGNHGAFVPTRSFMGHPERKELVEPHPSTVEMQEQEEERRKLRRLQIMMSMVMSVISQDAGMSVEEASELAANAKRAALAMFPDKEFAYDILYKPRLQRLMAERFHIQ
jgi:hypothetical protein